MINDRSVKGISISLIYRVGEANRDFRLQQVIGECPAWLFVSRSIQRVIFMTIDTNKNAYVN